MGAYSSVTKIGLDYAFIAFVFLAEAHIFEDDKNALTFEWYDNVAAEKVDVTEADKNTYPTKHLAEYSKLYQKINGTVLLEATNFASTFPESIAWIPSAGFVDTVFYSYENHHNLIIRPDDIWTAIIVQFSLYVNANAEALRHSFVNFEGKEELEVTFFAPIDRVPIDDFIRKIVTLIDDNIDPSISNWISPNFTTTTENDKLTSGVALMATLQKYFSYKLSIVLCGIPNVTILGEVDDWIEIRKRVERLKEFELNGKDVMDIWSSMLGQILDQFISVKEGNRKNSEFWKQAIRVDYPSNSPGCSYKETILNGWLTAFSAFDKSGHWNDVEYDDDYDSLDEKPTRDLSTWFSISTDKITPGIVQVPIKIHDQFEEAEERHYTGAIVTGHMGYSVKKDETTIQPLSGWAMAITNNPPKYLR